MKYYAIIADCTPDISRNISYNSISGLVRVEINEHLLGFCSVNGFTGSGLTEVLLDILTKRGVELSNCSGQGYDNGSNYYLHCYSRRWLNVENSN